MTTPARSVPTQDVGKPDLGWNLSQGVTGDWWETSADLIFPQSMITYGRMRHDLQIKAVLSAYKLPLLRATWMLDPEGCKTEVVKHVSDDLGMGILGTDPKPGPARRRGVIWHRHLREALHELTYGFMPFERRYEVMPDGYTRLDNLGQRMPWTVATMNVAPDGVLQSITQTTQSDPIAARRLVWYVTEQEGASWAGVSPLRSAFGAWLLKHEAWRVHATSIRRFGMGVPQVTAPQGGTNTQVQQAMQMAQAMRAGDQAGMGLPFGFEAKLMGLSGGTPDALGWIEYLDRAVAKSALAGLIELGQTETGSRALGETFLDLFYLSLQAVADEIALTATSGHPGMPGIVTDLVDVNWGPDEPAPRIVCTDVGENHQATADALQALLASGAISPDPALEEYIRKSWRLPDRTTPPPSAAPPPAEPGPPAGQPPLPPGGRPPLPGGKTPAALPPANQPQPKQPQPQAAWDEGDHPRNRDGEFTDKPGGAGGGGGAGSLQDLLERGTLKFEKQLPDGTYQSIQGFRDGMLASGAQKALRNDHDYYVVHWRGAWGLSSNEPRGAAAGRWKGEKAAGYYRVTPGLEVFQHTKNGVEKQPESLLAAAVREWIERPVQASAAHRREEECGFDAAAHQAQWESALGTLVSQVREVAWGWRADLVDQVEAAAGKPQKLALAAPDLGSAPQMITDALQWAARQAAAAAMMEAAGQGVHINPERVRIDHRKLAGLAEARAQFCANALAQAASAKALQVQAAVPGAEVAVYLDGVTDQNLREQLGAALTAAQNAGRMAAFEAAPADATAEYVATEVLDTNTCRPCRDEDGTVFPDVATAEASYPSGGFRDCLGLARCRGTVMAVWNPQAATARAAAGDAGPKARRQR